MVQLQQPSLFLFLFFLTLHLYVTEVISANITIVNKCNYTVWPAVNPSYSTGFVLKSGEKSTIKLPSGWSGRIWGRTLCKMVSDTKFLNCTTGDCGGALTCVVSGDPPLTLAEFTLNGTNNLDFYDITIIDGYNLPIEVVPLDSSGKCYRPVCSIDDLHAICPPSNSTVTKDGTVVGCYTDNFKIFSNVCPDVYLNPTEDEMVHSCPSTNYQVVFCPFSNNTSTPTINASQQAPTKAPSTAAAPIPTPTITNSPVPTQAPIIGSHSSWKRKVIIGVGSATMASLMMSILICCFRGKSLVQQIKFRFRTNKDKNIEAFLKDHGALLQKRYKFSEIRKMTNSFKVKLGQGGFGVVYKGKLVNGCSVAVKILNASKGNGEEFVNEVASITRTSHVNVVTLLGFCFEGRKKALIYEFMSNGSLDTFIYNKGPESIASLSWDKLYQIAKGIARGLEYLHRGCTTRILHFDIKPHNILLDENFCPKISDFGLAKLCLKKESIISMSGQRGTMGYVAPEMWNRHFGGVSYKSDVYSYGMLLLEMVGGRKNINVDASHTSEIYFPHWVYNRLNLGNDLRLDGIIMDTEEDEIARRMSIVGLWCIQTLPNDRPTMSEVIEMLEVSMNSLEIPPKPLFSSPTRSVSESCHP